MQRVKNDSRYLLKGCETLQKSHDSGQYLLFLGSGFGSDLGEEWPSPLAWECIKCLVDVAKCT